MTEPAARDRRLVAARTRLIVDRPFLGALVLRLPLVAAGAWCRTTATDARAIYYNPAWIDTLSAEQLQFVLAHDALHCALGHFARRGHRDKARWDLACDLAVNPLLVAEGLMPPASAVVLMSFIGMSAEEIYASLDDNPNDDTFDDHAWDGDDGGRGASGKHGGGGGGAASANSSRGGAAVGAVATRPPPLTALAADALARDWERRLAGAAQRAREAGKLSAACARLTDAALATQLPWRAVLAGHLSRLGRDDYAWQRPSRRGCGADGEALLPSLRSPTAELAVAVDVSGSISDGDLAQFFGELGALKRALPTRITLFACDSALVEGAPWIFEPWETLALPATVAGGGGTSFRPVFEWLARADAAPDGLLWFTDADGEFPDTPPAFPVLWLVKGQAPVPWGQRIALC